MTVVVVAFVGTIAVGAVTLFQDSAEDGPATPSVTTPRPTEAAPLPSEAMPATLDDFTDEQTQRLDLRAADQLYRIPLEDGHSLGARIRDGETPLLFGTSCDLVSSYPLPRGWEGLCLEYTSDGQRITGVFPHGTTSRTQDSLTLLDGTEIVLSYPGDLDLSSAKIEAEIGGILDGQRRVIEATRSPWEQIVTGLESSHGEGRAIELIAVPPGDTGAVTRWEFDQGPQPVSYLVYDFAPWTVTVAVEGIDGDDTPLTGSMQDIWARFLEATVTPDGYLVLTAIPPLELTLGRFDGPDMTVQGSSGGLMVFTDGCPRLSEFGDESSGTGSFAWCDDATNTLLVALGDAQFSRHLHETLVVRSVAPGAPVMREPVAYPESGPIFREETRKVLLFSDGLDGVTAVDPDRRIAARSVIEGERAGDQRYRLTRIGDHLVVGWGEIYAHDIHTRQSALLGEATIYVPAAETDRVWLIDYPGGRIGQGTPMAWQVDAEGNTHTEPAPVDVEGSPAIGVAGGLAVETDDGVAIWDATTGEVTRRLGTGTGFVSDVDRLISRVRRAAAASWLAWCEDTCTEMHITNLATAEDLVVTHPEPGRPFDARSARFSHDGRFLAAPAGSDVVILDLEEGAAHVGFSMHTEENQTVRVVWDPFGPFLYAATNSYPDTATTVAWHEVVVPLYAYSGETNIAVLPFGGLGRFTLLPRSEAGAFLTDQFTTPELCRPPSVYPSGRTSMCGFEF